MRREGRYIDLDEDGHDRDPEEVAKAHRRKGLMTCSKAELIMMLDMSKDRIAFLDSTIERNTDRYYAVIEERDQLNMRRKKELAELQLELDHALGARGEDFRNGLAAACRTLLLMDGQPQGLAVASGLATALIAIFNSLPEMAKVHLSADVMVRDAMTALLKKACKLPRNNEQVMMLYDPALWELAERVRNKPDDAPDSCGCGHPGAHPPCSYCTTYATDEEILEMED